MLFSILYRGQKRRSFEAYFGIRVVYIPDPLLNESNFKSNEPGGSLLAGG